MNQDDEENFNNMNFLNDRDNDDDISQSDDDQERNFPPSPDKDDEQHQQKVNGQVESLQQKLENLTKELIYERHSHEDTKLRKQMDEQVYHEHILQNNQHINGLQDKIADLSHNTLLRAEISSFCARHMIHVDVNAEDIHEVLSSTLRDTSKLLDDHHKTVSRKTSLLSPKSNMSSPRYSIHGSSALVSSILINEFMKFCLKSSVFVDNSNTESSSYNEEKCCMILQKASKMINDHTIKIKNLEAELKMSLNANEDIRALKAKLIQLVERIRIEKDHKIKAEHDTMIMKKKLEMLSEHMEKLMAHLKHEATTKLRIADQLRTSERDFMSMKDTCEAIQKKSTAKDRLIFELREGSKILEDQLRLMDEKYLELRSKLDWAREVGATKLRKSEKKANELRMKFALATNSASILDNVTLPSIYANQSMSRSSTSSGMNMMNNMMMNDGNIGSHGFSMISTSSSSRNNHSGGRLSRNGKNQSLFDMTRATSSGSAHDEPVKEPSMEHVLEKLRLQENKKREWTDEKLRKLVESR